jgi:3-hydroxyacyl-CoA dehydrogenase/enoyl-CoA hydratase/3-hydroxybutyryl-CoA epimerase
MVSPERLALFNPYHPCLKSDLVEISTHSNSDSLATIQSFAKSLALTPIPVKSAAGYLGTRLMMAFLTEAMLIHQSGASISAIDKQALKMGMRHAPFELIDNIGITECLRVTEALADRRGIDVPNVLIHKKEHGLEGKRSGAGFYRYKNGVKHDSLLNHKLSTSHKRLKPAAIEQRIIEKIINEARACLKEELVEDEAILDLVASLTTGFPVKHGGPLSYLKTIQTANKTITQ